MKKNHLIPLVLCILGAKVVMAAEQSPQPPIQAASDDTEIAELERLLTILDEQTEIATKTKLNADYVPGMVTVLDGDSLESRGARTVWEALSLVPGIETSIDTIGRKQIIVRGVGRTYASGNVKLLLNNIALNKASDGLATPVYNIPISIVERIEVVRGPGSAIHGEIAYVGVINVVTRNDGNMLTTSIGSNNTNTISLISSYGKPSDDFQYSMSLSDNSSDGSNIIIDEDATKYDPNAATSNAPGTINDVQEFQSAILNLRYKNTQLSYQHLYSGFGDHYGIRNALPPDKRIVTQLNLDSLELKHEMSFGKNVQASALIGQVKSRINKDRQFLWNGGYFGGFFSDDTYNKSDTIEQRRYVSAEILVEPNDSHKLLLGTQFVKSKVVDINNLFNLDSSGSTPTYNPATTPIVPDSNRVMRSFLVQDEYQFTKAVTVTAGLRHDRYTDSYSDIGNSNTARLAAVWRASDAHIFKLQYAEAFRPPTFLELDRADPTKDIEAETIATTEIGYIFKTINTEARVTVFSSKLHDLISIDPAAGFANKDEAVSVGAEAEYEQRLSNKLKLDANVSYVNTEDKSTNDDIPGSTNLLMNIGLSYKPHHNLLIIAQHRRVGDFNRAAGDSRPNLEGYYYSDLTLNISNPDSSSINIKLGIKNIEDNHYAYPAPVDTYPDEYEYGERTFWGQLSFNF